MQQLFETVDVLSSLKVNHLQLYTEHTFAYAGHEEVWHGCSPVTPDEVRQLDHYCEQRGVELAANQNCFGHLARWLKLPRYAHLAETHGDFPFLGQMRRGPFSLCPIAPGSIALVDDLLSQLLPCFRSKRVNVGCDETFDVGFGRSREAVELHGRAAVYFKYVAKVAKIAERLGKWPMFWADMALAHPDSIDLIPASMTALVWGYEANSPFERSCRLLRDLGREAWVCPGTSSWRSIVGRTSVRRANLTAAARQGWIAGAAGCLVTDWGDLGHYQQWPTSLHGLAEAAATAWNTTVDRFDPRTSGLHAFGDATGWVGLWLDELGDVDAEIRDAAGPPDEQGRPTPLRNASALFTDLHEPIAEQPMTGDALAWERVRRRLEALGDHFPIGLPALLADELQHTLAVAQLAADRAVARRMERGVDRHVRRRFAVRLDEIIAEHRRLWLQRCREGGLDESCSHYQTIAGGD
jgi:hexosaminidase